MPEIRSNPITGDWVIIATERARRPEEFTQKAAKPALPPLAPDCPFCPGNESKTPAEQFRVDGTDGGWLVRAVPNRFAALTPEGTGERHTNGFRTHLDGVGLHEVIIEAPAHDATMARLPIPHLVQVLQVYRHRLRAFYKDRRIEHVILFKNHGEAAGTSLVHPHSQIVGMPVLPSQLRARLEEAMRHWGNAGECLYCRTLHEELRDGARMIAENSSFAAFVPYAALSPFHIWFFPKHHSAYFGEATDAQLADLAGVLHDVLRRLDVGLADPDYNFVIRSLSPQESALKYFHWYISLVPRVTKSAGFELGTGMFINTALPERSAEFLRRVSLPA
ncbi:MAG TPA: galactose-1-phosphate uridylyltransferase [Thermoanaerobaculaceae bacterium]|nr:galactose-1-phosphate uridylyltransferase [Thermoanaerobaculaceae bacterium]